MSEVVAGWGVWLETIEITDVKVLSRSLFQNMQSRFREQQKKTATLQSMEVEARLKEEQLNHSVVTYKRD